MLALHAIAAVHVQHAVYSVLCPIKAHKRSIFKLSTRNLVSRNRMRTRNRGRARNRF